MSYLVRNISMAVCGHPNCDLFVVDPSEARSVCSADGIELAYTDSPSATLDLGVVLPPPFARFAEIVSDSVSISCADSSLRIIRRYPVPLYQANVYPLEQAEANVCRAPIAPDQLDDDIVLLTLDQLGWLTTNVRVRIAYPGAANRTAFRLEAASTGARTNNNGGGGGAAYFVDLQFSRQIRANDECCLLPDARGFNTTNSPTRTFRLLREDRALECEQDLAQKRVAATYRYEAARASDADQIIAPFNATHDAWRFHIVLPDRIHECSAAKFASPNEFDAYVFVTRPIPPPHRQLLITPDFPTLMILSMTVGAFFVVVFMYVCDLNLYYLAVHIRKQILAKRTKDL